MERNMMDERSTVQGVNVWPLVPMERMRNDSKLRFFRLRFETLLAFLIASCFLGTLGCNVFGRPTFNDSARYRGERTLDDKTAQAAWSTASKGEGETRYTALKPIDTYSTSSEAFGEEEEKPSLSSRIKAMFQPSPESTKRPDANFNGAYELNRNGYSTRGYSQSYPQSSQLGSRVNAAPSNPPRTTFSSFPEESEQKDGGFWSKLFPPRPSNAPTAANSHVVQTPQRFAGSGQVAKPVQTGGIQKPQNTMFGKLVPTRRQNESRSSSIEQYDQARFLPPYQDVEKYYYPSGPSYGTQNAAIDPRFSQVGNRENNSLTANQTALGSNGSVYGSIPKRNSAYDAYSRNGAHPTLRQSGSATLSPILRTDENLQTSREGSVGMNSVGVTRKFSGQSQSNPVAQVRYMQRRLEPTPLKLVPESLYGWSEDTRSILESVQESPSQTNVASGSQNVDYDFMSSLGRQPDKTWFNVKQTISEPGEVLREREQETVESVDQESGGLAETLSKIDPSGAVITNSANGGDVDNVSTASNDSNDLILADPEASLDEIFDAAVKSGDTGNEVADNLRENGESFESQSSEVPANDPLTDSLPDDFPQVGEQLEETVGSLSPLSEAPMKSAAPLVETQEAEVSSHQDNLIEQAQESGVSIRVPEKVVERKVESGAAPLTQEEIEWVGQVKSAIQGLLTERRRLEKRGADTRAFDARLRLLYLVIGEYDRSIQEIQDDSDPLKIFWEKECRGLETLLQNQLEEIDPSFVADRLQSGLETLSGLCKIKIRKAALVVAPACYGLYEIHEGEYASGDVVYAYTELDYVTSKETSEGFNINVECRWRLLDSNGKQIIPFESQLCSNVSETKLRDVVLNVSVPLPTQIETGTYVLEIEVVDMNSGEPAASVKRMQLSVKSGENPDK